MQEQQTPFLPPTPKNPKKVIAVCKSADLLLMVLDATKPWHHRDILTRELEAVGMRLNRRGVGGDVLGGG